jgi:hypothetical protein
MMGGRQIVEALPSEILRDPSMRDMLNTSMLSLPVLNHLPAIGVRPLMSRGAAMHRLQQDLPQGYL